MTELPSRKPNRLKDYDYSQNGCYFITICVKDRRNILWKPSTDNVEAIINHPLSKYGEVVERAIAQIPNHYECVNVDKYIIMPNHIHMIITINNHGNTGRLIIAPTVHTIAPTVPANAPTVSTIVKGLKSHITKQLGFSMWQKSFHDSIIRNETEYLKIWHYIDCNPLKWHEDIHFDTGD